MASRATNTPALSRYFPYIALLTCAAAAYGIYHLHSAYSSPSAVVPPETTLRRRSSVRRRRHSLPHHQPVSTPEAVDAIAFLAANEGNASMWSEKIAIDASRSVEVSLLPSTLHQEASRVQRAFDLDDGQKLLVENQIQCGFLRRFFSLGLPSSYIIGQTPGEKEWIVQELGLRGIGVPFILEGIRLFNGNNATAGLVVPEEYILPRADGTMEDAFTGRASETAIEDDGGSEFSWRGGNGSASPPKEAQGLLNLMYHIAEDKARREGYVHRGVTCNSCGVMPILGIRYRCANCVDYDLCETCEAMGVHTKTHVFYKVRLPAPFLGSPRQAQSVWYPGKPISLPRSLPRSLVRRIMKDTGFEQAEMDALWEQFRCLASVSWPDDPNEIKMAIDRKTFDKCFVPNTSFGPPPENLIYDRMFRFYDTNNDRLIGFEEFIKGLACLNNKNKEERLKRIFQGYDIDEDGFVSRIDFLRMFRAFYVLTKELTRDMIAGMGEEFSDGLAHDTVTGSQAISGHFTGIGNGITGEPSRPGEGKYMTPHGDLDLLGGEEALRESSEDVGERNTVVEDAAERAEFGQLRVLNGPLEMLLPSDTRQRQPPPALDAETLERLGDADRGSDEPWRLPPRPSASAELAGEPQQIETERVVNGPLHGEQTQPEAMGLPQQIVEPEPGTDRNEDRSRVGIEDIREALHLLQSGLEASRPSSLVRGVLGPNSPENTRRASETLQEDEGADHTFPRAIRATSQEMLNLGEGDSSDPHERSGSVTAEELQHVQSRAESGRLDQQQAQTLLAGDGEVGPVATAMGSPDASRASSVDSDSERLDSYILEEDIVNALGRGLPDSEWLSHRERALVRATARARIEAAERRDVAHARSKGLRDRWRRRQFYVDEEDGTVAPKGYVEGSEDAPGPAPAESSTVSDSRPQSPRSRSSSKVRFQDDLTDTDYDADTRSNHSNSSRRGLMAERWGGYQMKESEKDVGKEILYQASQEGLNELLNTLFKPKEDLAIEAALSAPDRRKWKKELDDFTAAVEETTVARRSLNYHIIATQAAELSIELGRGSGDQYPTDPPGTSPLDSLLAANGYDYVRFAELFSTPLTGPPPPFSPATPPFQPQHFPDLDLQIRGFEDLHHDPTLPQFRPSSPSIPAPDPLTTETPPSAIQLLRWTLHNKVDAEAKERGGNGRLDFMEFGEILGADKLRRLTFVGAWIEMASFWSP